MRKIILGVVLFVLLVVGITFAIAGNDTSADTGISEELSDKVEELDDEHIIYSSSSGETEETEETREETEDSDDTAVTITQEDLSSYAQKAEWFVSDETLEEVKEEYGVDIEAIADGDYSSIEQYLEDGEIQVSQEDIDAAIEYFFGN